MKKLMADFVKVMPDLGVGKDKIAHFIVGFLLGAVGTIIDIKIGFILPTTIGLGKELWDMQGNGHACFIDFLATILGGLAGAMLICVLKLYL